MFSEIGNHCLPVTECRCGISKQILECCDQLRGVGDVYIQCHLSVLVEDNSLRRLEEGIVERVACVPFLRDGFRTETDG